MLCRRKIELRPNVPELSHPVIPRQIMTDFYEAKQLLNHANTQAEELLSMAKEKCEALQKKAALEFWERANAQLFRWGREHQEMCASLEQHATVIVNRAIKQLLDETAAPQRIKVILKQLLENQVPEVNATLHCCPDELENIKNYFANHKAPPWRLQPDDTIMAQTLVLKTEQGDFCISWDAMLENFLKHSKERQ